MRDITGNIWTKAALKTTIEQKRVLTGNELTATADSKSVTSAQASPRQA